VVDWAGSFVSATASTGIMTLPSRLPKLPADHAARLLALTHLEAARTARARLVDPADGEALHDYRVALRRLRSCLRAYRSVLRSTVSLKSSRRLRGLADATRASRDLEVHLGWLRAQREAMTGAEGPGFAWVSERLEMAERRARLTMMRCDARRFPWVYDRLRAELSQLGSRLRPGEPDRRRGMAAVTARQMRKATARLRRRLRGVRGDTDIRAVHRARIAAKHLRYLLDPWADAVPGGQELVERLKALQDAFGDVHDAWIFMRQLGDRLADFAPVPGARGARRASRPADSPIPGVKALARLLHQRGRLAFTRAREEWLGDSAEPHFRRLAAAADAVAVRWEEAMRIEGTVVLTGLSPDGLLETVEIEQVSLSGERATGRGDGGPTPGGERLPLPSAEPGVARQRRGAKWKRRDREPAIFRPDPEPAPRDR
jgi:CHAD domain-containing protein